MTLPWHADSLRALIADSARLPHALLIHGPVGIGKREFADALAQRLLCERPLVDGQACGECVACRGVAQGAHPDFLRIVPEAESDAVESDDSGDGTTLEEGGKRRKKAASSIRVEQIRQLRDFVSLTSGGTTGWRVVIVRPADAITESAANAMLKFLEEPPAGVLLLLITDRPARLLPTVVSRCRRLPLGRPARGEALAWLAAQGVADAEVLLDQSGGAPLLALELATEDNRVTRRKFLDELARLAQPEAASLLAGAHAQAPLAGVLRWLATWCHDLASLRLAGQVRFNRDYASVLARLAPRVGVQALFGFADALRDAARAVNHPLNQRLVLEDLLLSYGAMFEESAGHG